MNTYNTLLEELKKITQSYFDSEEEYHFVLIGSFGRKEPCIDNRMSYSDMEAFLICHKNNVKEIARSIQEEFSKFTEISLDFDGATYEKFSSFKPKQWLIEAAKGSYTLIGNSHAIDNPFNAFAEMEIPDHDWTLLLMNRWIEFSQLSDNQPYFCVKLWTDITSSIINYMGYETVTLKNKKDLILSEEFKEELFELYGKSLYDSILVNAHLALDFKISPTKNLYALTELDRSTLFGVWKRTIGLYLTRSSDYYSNELLVDYFNLLLQSHHSEALPKEWIKDFTIDAPFCLACLSKPRLAPRWQLIINIFKTILTDCRLQGDSSYNHWKKLVKNA